MPPNRHLSVSQIKLLLGCARQWRYSYLDHLKTPPNVHLVVGVVWHAAIEHLLNTKIRDGVADPIEARFALDAAWDKEAGNPNIDWQRTTPGEARRLCDRLFDAYVKELAPLIVPVEVETPFSVAIPGARGWTLDGRIDAVADDGWLVDQKTAGKPYTAEQVDADPQALAYLWAWRELHGAEAPGVAFHVAVKGPAIVTQELVTRRTPAQLEWFVGLLGDLVRQVEAQALPPNSSYQWCRTCPPMWRDRCMPWRAQVLGVPA